MDWETYYEKPVTLKLLIETVIAHEVFLHRIVRCAQGPRLLETGIGTSAMSLYLSALGYRVTGLDRSFGLARQGASTSSGFAPFGAQATFVAGDFFHLPFADRSFDVCFHQGVLEHFDEAAIVSAVTEQLRVARRVAFSIPTEHYPQRDFGDERLWPLRVWRRILKPFRIVDQFGYFLLPGVIRRLNHLVPQRLLGLISWDSLSRGIHRGFVLEKR